MGLRRWNLPVHAASRRRIPCQPRVHCCEFVGIPDLSSGVLRTRTALPGELMAGSALLPPGVALENSLMVYGLATYALTRTPRTPQDWRRVRLLAARLAGHREIGVPVEFLGLWDMVKVPGRQAPREPLTNVVAGRHAVAVDGGHVPLAGHLVSSPEHVEEVWFRGAHRDVAGGPGACLQLADIALDWMLDGAVQAGITVRGTACDAPTPSEYDALAGSAQTISLRRLPASPLVHASVDVYVRAHPEYWRRLPAHVVWADTDWLARSERLVHAEPPAAPVEPAVLAAAAS